jgi:hypothetical protein
MPVKVFPVFNGDQNFNRKTFASKKQEEMIMTEQAKIKFIWDNISYENPLLVQKYFEKHMHAFIEFIITKTLEKGVVEVGTYEEGWQKGSMIRFFENENDKKLELRSKRNNSYEILLSIKRADEKEQVVKHKLSAEEIKLIPQHFAELMQTTKEA